MIAEPRSGSTNLGFWFQNVLSDFVVLKEPYNVKSSDFIHKERGDIDWIDKNKNYLISEKYYPKSNDLERLINIADIIFCLYREDEVKQIESFVVASVTNRWYGDYCDVSISKKIENKYKNLCDYFKTLKQDFQKFIKDNNFKSYTYEDLYDRGKINDLKDYLKINTNTYFPYGKKYRQEVNKTRTLI